MTDAKYFFTAVFSDDERRQIVGAFQLFISKLMSAAIQVDMATPPLLCQDGKPLPQVPAPAPAPSVPQTAVRDRWARDRKGNELPNPPDCYTVNVHVFKAERKDTQTGATRMLVAFDSPSGQGTVNASCWDEHLFPFLALAGKEPKATLHIVKNGKYLNIVGVRA
jgi:hypothetical protein